MRTRHLGGLCRGGQRHSRRGKKEQCHTQNKRDDSLMAAPLLAMILDNQTTSAGRAAGGGRRLGGALAVSPATAS
jgi:hypothetical protein